MSTALSPAESFPFGEVLRDELEARGWSETDFARMIGVPEDIASEIIDGQEEISVDVALPFGKALGTSAELWLNLRAASRLQVNRE